MQIKDVDSLQPEIGPAAADLVGKEIRLHGMHTARHILALQKSGYGAGSQEPRFSGDDQLIAPGVAVAQEFGQRPADGPFRPLVPVIDGGIQEIDAAANGRDDGIAISCVGRVVGIAQVCPQPQARDPHAVELPEESAIARGAETISKAGGSFRRAISVNHSTIVTMAGWNRAIDHTTAPRLIDCPDGLN